MIKRKVTYDGESIMLDWYISILNKSIKTTDIDVMIPILFLSSTRNSTRL
jgi:hypothetical protein